MKTPIQSLRPILQQKSLDGLLITKPENVLFLTGFTGSFGFVLITRENSFLVTDSRYAEKAQSLTHNTDVDFLLFDASFLKTKSSVFSGKFALEDSVLFSQKKQFEQWFSNISFSFESHLVENLRRHKTQHELFCIQKAQDHVDSVLISFLESTLSTGITEKSLAFELEFALRDYGSFGLAFAPIVAFGENSAIPHHVPTEKKLFAGENILIDCGVSYQGYQSDMTRNFGWKYLSEEYQHRYAFLLDIQEKLIQEYRSNQKTKLLQQKTKKNLGDQADFYTHSLGHGIGLETHERPFFQNNSDDVLLEHDVVTCEPGLYYPGKFGIRIEDLLLITSDFPRVLSRTTKDLLVFSE